MKERHKFGLGDWVEVLSKQEILRTLDEKGQLEGMPFMPEMLQFCGKRFQVYKRAHKTCDPDLKSRRVDNAVHLETRCDGRSHDGCQAGCLIFWKEAWLKPASSDAVSNDSNGIQRRPQRIETAAIGCTEAGVWDHVREDSANGGEPIFVCQTTAVPRAGKLLKWWDIRQYIEDYSSGNVTLGRLMSGLIYSMYYNLSQSGLGLGPAMRSLYDKACPIWRGSRWPRKTGIIPAGKPTPIAPLDLQPGELVRIKSHKEILKTVDTESRNRGLWWDAELVPYTGRTFRVLRRVTKVIDERTGKMQELKNPSIILDSVVCQARYSACRMFCPRSTYTYWREIWLERVESQNLSGCGEAERKVLQ